MPFSMIVEFTAAPGKQDELRRELLKLVAPTRAEEGCIKYDLHQDESNSNLFVFFEIWSSKAQHAAHDESTHVAHIRSVLPSLLEGSSVVRKLFLQQIEA